MHCFGREELGGWYCTYVYIRFQRVSMVGVPITGGVYIL